jgi:hypothetical protein
MPTAAAHQRNTIVQIGGYAGAVMGTPGHPQIKVPVSA